MPYIDVIFALVPVGQSASYAATSTATGGASLHLNGRLASALLLLFASSAS